MTGSCSTSWGDNPDTMGPFGIDYAYLYECSSPSVNPLVVFLYFLWIFYLITLLAQTASNYLSPTLSKICEKLHVAYDVAGVTFLAFGNGAPDFFSLIASFSGGVDILVGVGALLGGSMFVCTVVVGSIAILSPCEVSKRIFLRDISFHLISIIAVIIIALIGRVYFPMVICLYAMYIIYVLMVVISSSRDAANHAHQLAQQRYMKKKQKVISVEEMEIQTAFWHIDSTTANKHIGTAGANSSITMKRGISNTNSGQSSLSSSYQTSSSTSSTPFASSSSSFSPTTGNGGYSFLLLSNKDEKKDKDQARRGDDEDDDDDDNTNGSSNTNEDSKDSKEKNDPYYHRRRITISGGAPLDWDRIVTENYYSLENPRFVATGGNHLSSSGARVMVGEESAGGISGTKSRRSGRGNHSSSKRDFQTPSAAFTIGGDDDDDDEELGGNLGHRQSLSSDHGEGVRLIDFSSDKRHTSEKRVSSKPRKTSFLPSGEGLEASLLASAADDEGLSLGLEEDEEDDDNEDNEQVISFVSPNDVENPLTANVASTHSTYGFYDYRRLIPRSDGPNAWKLQTMYGSSVLTAMYWRQWTLRRSLRHRLIDDWRRASSVWEKAWVIIEAPASLARDLTIPTLEEAQWSKMIAMMHPVAAPIFALWILGFFGSTASSSPSESVATRHLLESEGASFLYLLTQQIESFFSSAVASAVSFHSSSGPLLPSIVHYIHSFVFKSAASLSYITTVGLSTIPATTIDITAAATSVSSSAAEEPTLSGFEIFLLIASSAGISLFIYLSTNTSRPPHHWLFANIWALSAFIMCILWIYALAGELITILSVLGDELRLPPAFLGLTVLAWGNSIGDFFTNTAVAKQGYGTMALAGCYGGPVFNLLIGFGSSLLYATIQAYSATPSRHYYHLSLDASSWISLVFIVIALSSTMCIVILRDYRMDRVFGMYLLTLYAVYSVVQAILVLVERG